MLPGQLQREDGQSKSASVFRGQLRCWTQGTARPSRGKIPRQVRSDTLSWSGLASHTRVSERQSRGEQPEQVTLQPGEEGEGEVTYRKRNVCYLSFKARDTGKHFSHPWMILISKKPDATIGFKRDKNLSTSTGPLLINNTPKGGSALAQTGPT